MQKRKIVIGDYDTASHGWTLTGWKLSDAEQKTNYVEKAFGDGSWDLSTTLTEGIPRYKDRSFTATLEISEGTRQEREEAIRNMVNLLDGYRWEMQLPDDEQHYIVGRVHVAREYNDLAHGAVTVTAVCDPWKYAVQEKLVAVTASAEAQTVQLTNEGRRAAVPLLQVSGSDASVTLVFGTSTKAVSAGTWQWPEMLLTSGAHTLTYFGTGKISITYREAVLE